MFMQAKVCRLNGNTKGEMFMGNVMPQEWNGFKPGRWSSSSINVRDFIQKNYTQYDGDASFLAPTKE